MRAFTIPLVLFVATTFAQSVPKEMKVYQNSSVVYTRPCSAIDSITHTSLRQLRVHKNDGSVDAMCYANIDSVTFDFIGGPAVVVHKPQPEAQFSVGDSMEISWTINSDAIPAGKVSVSIRNPSVSNFYTEVCLSDAECQVLNHDSRYVGNHTFTAKIKLVNPLATVGSVGDLDIVGDSLQIRVEDYDHYNDYTGFFSATSGYFGVQP